MTEKQEKAPVKTGGASFHTRLGSYPPCVSPGVVLVNPRKDSVTKPRKGMFRDV